MDLKTYEQGAIDGGDVTIVEVQFTTEEVNAFWERGVAALRTAGYHYAIDNPHLVPERPFVLRAPQFASDETGVVELRVSQGFRDAAEIVDLKAKIKEIESHYSDGSLDENEGEGN